MEEELKRVLQGGAKYLGDGLYAIYDGQQIRLFASNGVRITNSVYLEPEVLEKFEEYVAWIRKGRWKLNDLDVQHLLREIKTLARSAHPLPPDTDVTMEHAFALGEIIGVASRALMPTTEDDPVVENGGKNE